jgi:glycosyltransferase involved in cell wall biosynthesis
MFSIIIPTVNRPDLLARALQSVVSQTSRDYELLVIDDGDGVSLDVAPFGGAFGARLISSGRRGQVPARNLGVGEATHDWIAFLDDDDWWEDRDYLASTAEVIATGADFVYTSGQVVHAEEPGSPPAVYPMIADASLASLRTDNSLMVSGICYRKRLHEELGAFDTSLPIYWDWDWYLRVAASGATMRSTGRDGVRIWIHGSNTSADLASERRRAELDRLRARHGLPELEVKNHLSLAVSRQH